MPLPKKHYVEARTKKKLRDLQDRVDSLDKDLDTAERTILLLHEKMEEMEKAVAKVHERCVWRC